MAFCHAVFPRMHPPAGSLTGGFFIAGSQKSFAISAARSSQALRPSFTVPGRFPFLKASSAAKVVPPPDLRASKNRYIRGIGRLREDGQDVVLLLDWEKLFSEDEQAAMEEAQTQGTAPAAAE